MAKKIPMYTKRLRRKTLAKQANERRTMDRAYGWAKWKRQERLNRNSGVRREIISNAT